MVRGSCAVLVVVIAACGPTREKPPDASTGSTIDAPGDGAVSPHTLMQIVVSPTNPIVQLDLNQGSAQAFTAMGLYADGTSDDVTTQVTWSVGNMNAGTMVGATLVIPSFATVSAEVSTITA